MIFYSFNRRMSLRVPALRVHASFSIKFIYKWIFTLWMIYISKWWFDYCFETVRTRCIGTPTPKQLLDLLTGKLFPRDEKPSHSSLPQHAVFPSLYPSNTNPQALEITRQILTTLFNWFTRNSWRITGKVLCCVTYKWWMCLIRLFFGLLYAGAIARWVIHNGVSECNLVVLD